MMMTHGEREAALNALVKSYWTGYTDDRSPTANAAALAAYDAAALAVMNIPVTTPTAAAIAAAYSDADSRMAHATNAAQEADALAAYDHAHALREAQQNPNH